MSRSKYIVILGAQESGVGAALLAKQMGERVFVSDYAALQPHYESILQHYGIAYESGQHSWDRIKEADLVVKSPGIPNDTDVLKRLEAKGTCGF
jgi:UDP-N-acetylmuramoylalanine--D-glutamate ligase